MFFKNNRFSDTTSEFNTLSETSQGMAMFSKNTSQLAFFLLLMISIIWPPADTAAKPGSMFSHLADVLWIANPDSDGQIDVPGHIWEEAASTGAFEMRFRLSREIRAQQDPTFTMNLIDSPLLQLDLQEQVYVSRFLADISGRDESVKPVREQLMISHLKPQWYHLIVTWQAETGIIELYLNGVLQMSSLDFDPWEPLSNDGKPVKFGGTFGEGQLMTQIEVADVSIRRDFVNEKTAQKLAETTGLLRLDGEGRSIYDGGLDLSGLDLNLIYEADFTGPLKVEYEEDLFEGDRRVREPEEDTEWVFEGVGEARTRDGNMIVDSPETHVVLWNTNTFPENFLLEFTMRPVDPEEGLAIVFFSAAPVKGESIFSPGLPKRHGLFEAYTRDGHVNSYHMSYMALFRADESGVARPRRVANMRKNDGFYMVAGGDDRVTGNHEGFNRIRILKHGNRIRLETNGRLSIAFDDDESLYGLPVWGEGMVGLRQMQRTEQIIYDSFKVYEIE